MNSETVGIPGGSEAYDIDDVAVGDAADLLRGVHPRRAVVGRLPGLRQRLPRLHRHEHRQRRRGSTTMSRRGDVVEYTGTDRPMTLDNGYGDWNESFAKYSRAPRSS